MTAADRARAESVRAVAAVLRGRLAPTLDPDHVAALTLDALHDAGLRLHLHRPPVTSTGPGDPPSTEWRQAADRIRARQQDRP